MCAVQKNSLQQICAAQRVRKKRIQKGVAEFNVDRWEVVRDFLVKDSTLGEWKLSFILPDVSLTFNRHLLVRTIPLKAEVQGKDNMRSMHERNASGRCKESGRCDVDHIECKMLFTGGCHFCDLILTTRGQRYCLILRLWQRKGNTRSGILRFPPLLFRSASLSIFFHVWAPEVRKKRRRQVKWLNGWFVWENKYL